MMMKTFSLVLFLLLPSAIAFAQKQPIEYNKVEVFAGYSSGAEATVVDDELENVEHGFNSAAVYNFHRFFGVKVDVSGTYKNYDFGPLNRYSHSIHNVTAGIQVKNNKLTGRVKPFGHVLVGLGLHSDNASSSCPCQFLDRFEDKGVSLIIGGGLDIRVNRRIDIRVFQLDANPIYFDQSHYLNTRFSTGVIFKF